VRREKDKKLTNLDPGMDERMAFKNAILSTLQEAALDGILVVDENGKMLSFNQRFIDMWGIPPEVVESKSDERALQSVIDNLREPQQFLEKVKHLYKQKHETSRDEITLKDGRTFDRYSAPIFGSDTNYYGRVWYFRDITERRRMEQEIERMGAALQETVSKRTLELKKANQALKAEIAERIKTEEALRESEEKYRNILESMSDSYFETDLLGNMTFCNPMVPRSLGYSPEEMAGMNHRVYMDPENVEIVERNFRDVYRANIPSKVISYEVMRKDGTKAHIETSVSLIKNKDGRSIGYCGISRDITWRIRAEEERKVLQERLQRSEKMESLGTLAGGVAHDLNNVLGVVVGYAELLLMDADESSPTKPSLVKIMKGGEKAAAIVQDLLTMARRGVSGRQVLNLNRIIADSQQSPEFKNLSSYHPTIKIKTNLEPDLLNISGSSVHLDKTLFNLLSNASEAMPKGGIVTIKTANQYLDRPIHGYDEVREGEYVVLSVSDTGEGIHDADLKRIFEPFYTKKVMGRSGTGLGLAVVWGTVKDHNGYINVKSEEGKGSIFTLYFPVTREDLSAEAVAISISEYMGSGESILIVDDVKGQRDLAAGMLQKLNYNVASVSSGEEAIAYLKEHQVDLMVLDMIMDPGMDGLDTYKKVLEIHPQQKAIIVSGFSETDRVITAQSLGAGAYVRKPYVIEKLGLAIKKELGK